ncbi:hypothetical protein V1514DRAFT_339466 [Lipomyces japonicus]|uniref:uncharacterized protein n=1 Tax=Lipomyces japonicus TaxID=56871 RepID=UPI0034CF9F25
MTFNNRRTYSDIVTIDNSREVIDPSYAVSFRASPSFVVYDESFRQLLGSEPELTLVEERTYDFAHEAGVYVKSTNSVYFTANFQTSNPIELNSINSDTWVVKKLDYPLVTQANGACQYNDGVLYCSQGDFSTPSSLVLVNPASEKAVTLINNFHGRQFSSINDVVIHHETGEIWFTDPTYGYEQAFRPSPVLPPQVYRFNPETSEISLVADNYIMCNGLCFSPDYKKLYVTDTGGVKAHAGPGDGKQFSFNPRGEATIYEYDVVEKRYLTNRKTFAYADNGIPDGIKCDEFGNVYSGCGDGVHVWNSKGRLIGKIIVGSVAANFCFVKGGMWIFAEKRLYFARLKVKGTLVTIECE